MIAARGGLLMPDRMAHSGRREQSFRAGKVEHGVKASRLARLPRPRQRIAAARMVSNSERSCADESTPSRTGQPDSDFQCSGGLPTGLGGSPSPWEHNLNSADCRRTHLDRSPHDFAALALDTHVVGPVSQQEVDAVCSLQMSHP